MPASKKSDIYHKSSSSQDAINKTGEPADEKTNQRQRCDHCQKPLTTCHCDLLVNINNSTKVVILQHKKEAKHALNTAQLVTQCLSHSKIITCEDSAIALPKYLCHDDTYLLYPDETALTLTSPIAPIHHLNDGKQKNIINKRLEHTVKTLIVLDATWRKANKMLMTSPELQALKKIQLHVGQARGYTLRKAKSSAMLSTLEAVAYALSALEHDNQDYANLLTVLADFMALHSRHIPPEHLAKMKQRI